MITTMAMQTITCACGCGRKKQVRSADVNRGWGKYYSKSCKAKAQSKKFGGRGKGSGRNRVEILRAAHNEGRVSDEYFLRTMNAEYPEEMNSHELHDYIESTAYHPMSGEGLGQD